MEKASISVVYLCWLPYGIDCLKTFLSSYKKYHAGISHQFVIVFKGSKNLGDVLPFTEILNLEQILFGALYYTGSDLDISTYHWAASKLETEFIFFLNTRSIILSDNWLAFFYQANLAYPKTVCCATGSWQSYVSSIFKKHTWAYEINKSLKQNFNKYKLLLKAATLWWYYFPLFPNPHVRTNAFFIKRQLFLSLNVKKIFSKIDAYRFESGRNGFTKQLKNLGYKVAIVDASGKLYFEESWPLSEIFWRGEQRNLLITDNQTALYITSDHQEKKLLEKLAWGINN